jgi:hypothetical protein
MVLFKRALRGRDTVFFRGSDKQQSFTSSGADQVDTASSDERVLSLVFAADK